MARRSRWAGVSAPIFAGLDGTVRAMFWRPTRRATSSTMSISRSRSGRCVGATAVKSSSLRLGLDSFGLEAERRQQRPDLAGREVGAEQRVDA